MSEHTAKRVPPPTDEQTFERANEVLWSSLLNDESVQLYGRRGKEQFGVDATGIREGDPKRIVGIQCKCKGSDKQLSKSEVKAEVAKALTFKPDLSEYFICTTAPDDPILQSLALELSQTASVDRNIPLKIRIWGWGTMERQILRHPSAEKAFDPSHTPHADKLEAKLLRSQNAISSKVSDIQETLSGSALDDEISRATKHLFDNPKITLSTLKVSVVI